MKYCMFFNKFLVIIIFHGLQMQILLQKSIKLMHESIRIAGIIKIAGITRIIIRGRGLLDEIR